MDNALYVILVACFGSLVQEILHWYNLRKKLEVEEFEKLLNSKGYWIITILFILISGPVTFIILSEEFNLGALTLKVPFITGIGLPMILKKLIPSEGKDLGEDEVLKKLSFKDSIKLYLS